MWSGSSKHSVDSTGNPREARLDRLDHIQPDPRLQLTLTKAGGGERSVRDGTPGLLHSRDSDGSVRRLRPPTDPCAWESVHAGDFTQGPHSPDRHEY